ncbi:hypothetical protein E2C01_019173 [Portunus trituberculatus]|uniref:Uncharacterized protein n=1 Tax=Portunus trituberculatus TaxID=210409 RepID=A0A5B7DZ93_PORTR|nr:hypothetical protein [Portunus trituberculatus]
MDAFIMSETATEGRRWCERQVSRTCEWPGQVCGGGRVGPGVTCIAPRNPADYGTPPTAPHATRCTPSPPPTRLLPPQCSRRPHRAALDLRLQLRTRQPSLQPRAFYKRAIMDLSKQHRYSSVGQAGKYGVG